MTQREELVDEDLGLMKNFGIKGNGLFSTHVYVQCNYVCMVLNGGSHIHKSQQ